MIAFCYFAVVVAQNGACLNQFKLVLAGCFNPNAVRHHVMISVFLLDCNFSFGIILPTMASKFWVFFLTYYRLTLAFPSRHAYLY